LAAAHAQPLARLVLARRYDERLHNGLGLALLQRQKQTAEAAAVERKGLAIERIIVVDALRLVQLDANEVVGDDLKPDLCALCRQALHPPHDAERP